MIDRHKGRNRIGAVVFSLESMRMFLVVIIVLAIVVGTLPTDATAIGSVQIALSTDPNTGQANPDPKPSGPMPAPPTDPSPGPTDPTPKPSGPIPVPQPPVPTPNPSHPPSSSGHGSQ